MAVVEHETEFACQVERLFDVLNDPRNRAWLSPPDVQVELIDPPEAFFEGCRFEFDVSAYGQRQRFVHGIRDWHASVGFAEQQISGPFGAMTHVRRIDSGNGVVRLSEHVDFEPPGGLLGMLLTESRMRSMFESGFAHQASELTRWLAAAAEPGS